MLKIVADDQIPYAKEVFSPLGKIIPVPGAEIHPRMIDNADALLVRTPTHVDARLLAGTRVRFVGTATAGYDHLDTHWLKEAEIAWGYAPGMNANAVAEYVISCLAYLRHEGYVSRSSSLAAVIGVGNVGSRVSLRLRQLGYRVIENDPPRADRDPHFHSCALADVAQADLICIHTPLIRNGSFPTLHLFNEAFLKTLKPGSMVLNAGRGSVVDNAALCKVNHIQAVLDVWEGEPKINKALLKKAVIGTPHIAGYSQEAKRNATLALYQQVVKFFNLNAWALSSCHLPLKTLEVRNCRTWEEILLRIYNPIEDMKRMLPADTMEPLRKNYSFRNEFSSIKLILDSDHPDIPLLKNLGFMIAVA